MIAGGGAMSILLWDVQTGRRIMTIGRTTGGIGAVAFSRDGRSVAASAGDHGLRLWETQTPTMIDLDRRYDLDVERRKTRRELLEINREP